MTGFAREGKKEFPENYAASGASSVIKYPLNNAKNPSFFGVLKHERYGFLIPRLRLLLGRLSFHRMV
jgi:hypothetical protein